MEKANERIYWIDAVKFICLFFVMLSHLEFCTIANELRQFYLPFYLSGFFFASGYTFKYREGFSNHLKKKIKQLFVPWLIFSNGNIILSHFLSQHPELHSSLLHELSLNFLQIRGLGDNMWFVSALFIAYIPFYFLVKLYVNNDKFNKKIFLFIPLFLFVLYYLYIKLIPNSLFVWNSNAIPWHIEYIPYCLCFMFLGYICKDSQITVNKKFFILYAIIYIFVIYYFYYNKVSLPLVIYILLELIKCIFGLILIIIVSKVIDRNKTILYIGKNTLVYIALHGIVLAIWEAIFKSVAPNLYLTICSSSFYSSIYSITFAIVISYILLIPTYVINKYFPYIIGKNKQNI